MKFVRLLLFVVIMMAVPVFIGILKLGLHQLFREGFWIGTAGCLICFILTLAAWKHFAVADVNSYDDSLPFQPEIQTFLKKYPGPLVLNGSRAKWWFVTVCGCAMTAAAIFATAIAARAAQAGQSGALGGFAISLLGICFFGFGTVAAVRLLQHGSLRLDKDGFEYFGFVRKRYRWAEVSSFGIFRDKGANVVFKTTNPSKNIWSRMNATALGGYDGRLLDTYGLRAENLLQLMRTWQRSALMTSDQARRSRTPGR